MSKLYTTIFFTLLSIFIFAQDPITEELKTLAESHQYETIKEKYTNKTKNYSAKALYYVGLAYFMTEDDLNCLKYIDLSIEKDASDPAAHYTKASTLNYMGNYKAAIESFQTAIQLKSDDAISYIGMGEAYYQLENYESALAAYTKATEQLQCDDRAYTMIPQIHADLGQNNKALEAYYIAKAKVNKESTSYLNVLYNIGLFEYLNGNYTKAEEEFLELLTINADDYRVYSKLIQTYYAQKEFEKAKPYKDKLYAAHDRGELKDNLQDMFCFDQFKWEGYAIQVFERYEEDTNKGDIYMKHIFYVIDSTDQIVLRVQTEFSPISLELGGSKYLLCASKDSRHFNPGIGFNDGFKYEDLKSAAINLFEKYLK